MGYNSTIITKKKQLKCGHFDFNFSKGRCKQCATVDNTLKRMNEAKKVDEENCGEDLNKWFKERDAEATGFCKHCGGKTCKGDKKYYKFSIAHILPKRYFKSVMTHKLNSIELCFWGKSCHTNFDNNILDIMDLNCFDEVIEKVIAMYPCIDKNERKYIPDVLMQYINTSL